MLKDLKNTLNSKKGEENKNSKLYTTGTTDRNGQYKLALPTGTYAIMVKDKNNGIDFSQAVTVRSHGTVRCRDIIGTR